MSTAIAELTSTKLVPLERLQALCDRGELQLIPSRVLSRDMGDRAREGDGVVGALAKVDGRPIRCYAHDASYVGGSLGAAGAETIVRIPRAGAQVADPSRVFHRAARFVRDSGALGLPLIVLVDTTGFLPVSQEGAGVIHYGAELTRAFRRSIGPAHDQSAAQCLRRGSITMNSKDLGADLTFAWPNAAIGIMAARSAVGIIHRGVLEAAFDSDTEEQRLAARDRAHVRGSGRTTWIHRPGDRAGAHPPAPRAAWPALSRTARPARPVAVRATQ